MPEHHFPEAPAWALTAGSLGRGFVWAALAFFLLCALLQLVKPDARKISIAAFVLGCLSFFGTFVTLGVLFLNNQFEFSYVFQHSELTNPTQYKIASIWSGQQGSFLLWGCTSALFALLTLRGTGGYGRWYTAIYSVFLAAIAGILAYESPFVLDLSLGKPFVPPDGAGLAPSLQNYWVVIHPPTIFLGFGSLTILFCYALSALITRDYKDWVARVRPWSMVSMTLVGVGLCMGGFWAYETLGWGGFWKWDPVENVSFVPWCFTAALIHGLIVQTTKGKWVFGNLLMGGLPFLIFVYGTFLTRAGFLDGVSIHSFAKMEHTAHMVLLWFLIVSTAGFVGLWFRRRLQDGTAEAPAGGLNREMMYKLGTAFLLMLGIAVGLGMSVPLVEVLMNQHPKVVEEHLYHLVVGWFFVPIMLLMAIGPFVSWRNMGGVDLFNRVVTVFSVTIGLLGVFMFVINNPTFGMHVQRGSTIDFPGHLKVNAVAWMTFLAGICLFTVIANLWRLVEIFKRSRPSAGAFLSHLGVAVAVAGLILSRGLERKQSYIVQEGEGNSSFAIEPEDSLPIWIQMKDLDWSKIYEKSNQVSMTVNGAGLTFLATPGFYIHRFINGEESPMVWPSINRQLSHDMYVTLNAPQNEASKPFELKPGQTTQVEVVDWAQRHTITYTITYNKMIREGEAGMAGTKFKTELTVEGPAGKAVVAPGMELGEVPPKLLHAPIDTGFGIAMLRMNAADKSAQLQMEYIRPVFPVDLYYKPLTSLVWLGAGILTLGGLLSAWNRRKVVKKSVAADSAAEDIPKEIEHALEPTA